MADDEAAPFCPALDRVTPTPEWEPFARLAATAAGTTAAVVGLLDDARAWREVRHGIARAATPGATALCRRVLATREAAIVADAARDPDAGGMRFQAGFPLLLDSGECVGALCVFDPAPREGLSEPQRTALHALARLCAEAIQSRRHRRTGEIAGLVMHATSDAIVCVNDAGIIISWNGAAERMFGRSVAEALGAPLDLILPPGQRAGHHHAFGRAVAGKGGRMAGAPVELAACRADGSEFPVELSLTRWGGGAGDGGFAAIVRDISERKAIEIDRQNTRVFLDTVIANLPVTLSVKDARTHAYLLINRAGEQMIGKPAAEIVGRTIRDLFPALGGRYEHRDRQAVAASAPLTIESACARPDGSVKQLRTKRIVLDGPERPSQYILSLTEDVTEVRQAEAAARLDGLTGMMNRASHLERLGRLVAAKTPLAVLKVDLIRFKSVNDQFGHRTGDELLRQTADRIRRIVEPSDTVARVGGNEFALVLLGRRPGERARRLAEAIVAALAVPFLIDRVAVHSGARIGMAISPDHGAAIDDLRRRTDLALRHAKLQDRGAICVFDAEMEAAAWDRRMLETDLRSALEAGQVVPAYQPVLSAETGEVVGVEALARWTHPVRGPIGPDVFIPLAEECGLIHGLGEQMLRRACADALAWPDHVRVAVNLSPLQFQHGDVYAMACRVLADSGLAPNRLQFEVTESLLIRDADRMFAELERLRALGIRVLMDDFGVGYSSLSYFERFPFDKVKIDKSFIAGIGRSKAAEGIIKAVVGLSRDLAMGVVAEGVETDEQAQFLVQAGCTHLQGYFFGRPLEAAAITAMTWREGGMPYTARAA